MKYFFQSSGKNRWTIKQKNSFDSVTFVGTLDLNFSEYRILCSYGTGINAWQKICSKETQFDKVKSLVILKLIEIKKEDLKSIIERASICLKAIEWTARDIKETEEAYEEFYKNE